MKQTILLCCVLVFGYIRRSECPNAGCSIRCLYQSILVKNNGCRLTVGGLPIEEQVDLEGEMSSLVVRINPPVFQFDDDVGLTKLLLSFSIDFWKSSSEAEPNGSLLCRTNLDVSVNIASKCVARELLSVLFDSCLVTNKLYC